MFELLRRAISPDLGLRNCVEDWYAVSVDLRERPRRRTLQIENIESEGILLS